MRSDAVREVVGFAWEKNGKRARGGLESVKVEFFFFFHSLSLLNILSFSFPHQAPGFLFLLPFVSTRHQKLRPHHEPPRRLRRRRVEGLPPFELADLADLRPRRREGPRPLDRAPPRRGGRLGRPRERGEGRSSSRRRRRLVRERFW